LQTINPALQKLLGNDPVKMNAETMSQNNLAKEAAAK
jgi:hypothetical protein